MSATSYSVVNFICLVMFLCPRVVLHCAQTADPRTNVTFPQHVPLPTSQRMGAQMPATANTQPLNRAPKKSVNGSSNNSAPTRSRSGHIGRARGGTRGSRGRGRGRGKNNGSPQPKQEPSIPGRRKKAIPWTEEEDKRLLTMVKQHGPQNWRKIAEYVGSRTPAQVGRLCRSSVCLVSTNTTFDRLVS